MRDLPDTPERSTFADGLQGSYQSARFDWWRLKIDSRGQCTHEENQSGVQGSSREVRYGVWAPLDDGRVTLSWYREDSDVEVGMSRDRGSRDIKYVEYAVPRWDGDKVTELRLGDETTTADGGGRDTYARVGDW